MVSRSALPIPSTAIWFVYSEWDAGLGAGPSRRSWAYSLDVGRAMDCGCTQSVAVAHGSI
jgi:hypothetical protein